MTEIRGYHAHGWTPGYTSCDDARIPAVHPLFVHSLVPRFMQNEKVSPECRLPPNKHLSDWALRRFDSG
jgi:hypothetical protein